nr:hypothetical protein [Sicyoidochytrium minutum DNA virus]
MPEISSAESDHQKLPKLIFELERRIAFLFDGITA